MSYFDSCGESVRFYEINCVEACETSLLERRVVDFLERHMIQNGGKFCVIEAGGWYYFDMTAGHKPLAILCFSVAKFCPFCCTFNETRD